MKMPKEYFELLDRWETEKQEGITPLWKGEKYREFKAFFGLRNRQEAWQMLDMIQDYLQSDNEGLKHDAELGTAFIEGNQLIWALFPRK